MHGRKEGRKERRTEVYRGEDVAYEVQDTNALWNVLENLHSKPASIDTNRAPHFHSVRIP